MIATDPRRRAQREVEEQAILTIARRQPMAVDLREIVARDARVPTISSASAISPRTSPSASSRSTATSIRSKLIRGVEHMAAWCSAQLKDVLDAYASRDWRAGARGLERGDEEIDAIYTSLFRELLTYMMEDPRNITLLHASDVLRQEHRAHRRPRHQHRRDGATT